MDSAQFWRDRYISLGQQICTLANIDARTVPADAHIILSKAGVTIEHIDGTDGPRYQQHHPWRLK